MLSSFSDFSDYFFSLQRNYDISLPHNKIHDALCLLSKEMAALAMPYGEEFHPEAAIVNYFGPSIFSLFLHSFLCVHNGASNC